MLKGWSGGRRNTVKPGLIELQDSELQWNLDIVDLEIVKILVIMDWTRKCYQFQIY